MPIWLWLIEGLLVSLVIFMGMTIARLVRQNAKAKLIPGSEASQARRLARKSEPHLDTAAESKAQVHLFWAAQMLEIRLKHFDRSRLAHPALQAETRRYIQGVADCVSDHYHYPALARERLLEDLQEKYVVKATDESDIPSFDLRQSAATPVGGESYQTGYDAAKHWLEHKKFNGDLSLLAAIHRWGFIS